MTTSTWRRFLSDADGRIVVAQPPNVPIVGWATLRVAAHLSHGHASDTLRFFADAFLFTWAYLELREGDSPFRRVLGGGVLAALVASRILG